MDADSPQSPYESLTINNSIKYDVNMTGVAYTRWGKSPCGESRQTTQMYSGFAASDNDGGRWKGGGGSVLCLPPEPQWNRYNNEKRVNKQCLLNTPRRVTVYHKNYFGNKISSCKCPMGVHHVGMISNCSTENCGRS